ncbi:MAG: bifunctional precorrin-2 dehydrogenase/sirohydrochlorin ferrochelatase [Deltaproteobacteria bacterium]|nr:bifunctional precorrin-2 dehydrogenase/sirohydrochlorin ferrochelatase [Deltaproteobacteria bacterium]
MTYFPVCLRVAGEPCVVIGGGRVAARKVAALLAAGARVTVIAPRLDAELAGRAAAGEIAVAQRPYRSGDLTGARLAFAATDDEALHAELARDAAAANVPLNVVDRPDWCSFIMPAVARHGALSIAVSTDGQSPGLAGRVRDELAAALGPEYRRAVALLGCLRQHLQARALPSAERQRILTDLVASDLLERLREPDAAAVDRLLAAHAGAGVSLASLGADLGDA